MWLEVTTALVLMDYAFYLWHVLMHRHPFLWRMHLVHHVDLDLDASTALRFHFMEMLASIPNEVSVDEGNIVGSTLPHSDFGDPDCCGCLNGIVRGDQADIVCSECGNVVRTVRPRRSRARAAARMRRRVKRLRRRSYR